MNKYPSFARLSSVVVVSALFPVLVKAADYSWNSATQSSFATASNWSPGGGPPGASDNIITPSLVTPPATAFGNVTLSSASVANFTYNSVYNWDVIGAATSSPLNISGDLSKDGTGTLTIRTGSSKPINLTVGGAITVANGTLALTALEALSAGSMSITGGTVTLSPNVVSSTTVITGALSMSGTSTFNIRNTAVGGTLSVGSLNSASSTSIIQVNATSGAAANATIELNNASGSSSFAGVIRNSGGAAANVMNVSKKGAGTQILTGLNTYSGTTIVDAGSLLINNASGSGTGTSVVTVNSGGRFGGTGSATGAVTVANGGTLVGGEGFATEDLSLSGNVTFSSGSIIEIALAGAGAHSSLTRTGGTWSFDANQTFSLVNLSATTGFYNNIISGLTGSETGLSSVGSWSIANSGWTGTFAYDGSGGIDLTVTSLTAVPEPASYAVFAGIFLAAFAFLRRRK